MPDLTCAGCGCVCDDGRTCPLGDAWLDLGERPPLASVDGVAVSLDEAVAAAAAILREARAPLVYGLGRTSIEAQRRAVALAEALGAVVDPGASPFAMQAIGSSTATFGEIRDRAELVILWCADPAVTHPRLLERLRVAPESLVVVRQADRGATQPPASLVVGEGFAALWELRARVTGAPLQTRTPSLDGLAQRLTEVRHVAFIHGALDDLTALALHSLVRDLNRDRHAVTLALRDGNARGAEDVVAWQTGFAGAVSFARGHPREALGAAALIERGDVDAVLAVAADPPVTVLPTVVVDAQATVTSARVVIAPAADGVEVPGTVHRMDGIPVPLRPPRTAERPSVEYVLAALEGRL
jgi:formylmethanofuran dehydrogenase subunit B